MKAIVKFNTLFVESAYSIEDIDKVKRYRPDALNLYKGEGKDKELVFGVDTGSESVGKYGISFASNSNTGEKHAVIAKAIPADKTNEGLIKEWIREAYGLAFVNLANVEDQIDAAMAEIASDEQRMDAVIEIEA